MDVEVLKQQLQPLDFTQASFVSSEQQEYFRHYKLDLEDRYPGVQHFFGAIPGDGKSLACHYFRCPQARGGCFILHGYYDHSGLFTHLIDYCIQRRLSVVVFDFPGHGLSAGERVCVEDFADYQQVLNDVMDYFEEEFPDPWYAIAQSTGSAVLMDYLLDNPQSIFTKTVLLAPLVQPLGWASVTRLAKILGLFLRRFPRRPSKSSSDPAFLQFIAEQDFLQSPTVSIIWLKALRRWIKGFLLKPACEHTPLVMQGREDSTVDWRYNIPVIKKKFPGSSVVYLDGARHHLANERSEIRDQLYRKMDAYLFGDDHLAN